jgi:predicted phage-related endonuclease
MAQLLEARKGIKCKADKGWRIRRSQHWPFMGATLDRWYYDDKKYLIPVEFKSLGLFVADWGAEPPIKVQIQVQHQICVCDAPYAIVVGFGGINRLYIHTVERDDRFITGLVVALQEFKWHIDKRIPPHPDGSMSTAKALLALHPEDDGLGVDLPPEGVKVAAQLRTAKELIKQLEEEKRKAENWIKAHIGPHTLGALPGGGGFTWKTQEKKEYVVKASKTRVLREVANIPKGIEFVQYQPKIEDQTNGGNSSSEEAGE